MNNKSKPIAWAIRDPSGNILPHTVNGNMSLLEVAKKIATLHEGYSYTIIYDNNLDQSADPRGSEMELNAKRYEWIRANNGSLLKPTVRVAISRVIDGNIEWVHANEGLDSIVDALMALDHEKNSR